MNKETLINLLTDKENQPHQYVGYGNDLSKIIEETFFPLILKRCLALGIKVYTFEIRNIIEEYNHYKMPDDALNGLDVEQVKEYAEGLYLCGCEMAREWTEGHNKLEKLGFKKQVREAGVRSFESMIWSAK